MAKILATEIRAGNLLEFDKRVWRVLKSYHVHVGGRGGAYMQIEIKDIESGQKRNERLSTDEKVERPFIDRRTKTYSYHDGDNYVFMDNETYEQLTLGADFLEGQAGYLMPNMEVEINFHNGRAIGISCGDRGAQWSTPNQASERDRDDVVQACKLETGISVQVPPFVNTSERSASTPTTAPTSSAPNRRAARSSATVAFLAVAFLAGVLPATLRLADLVTQPLPLFRRQSPRCVTFGRTLLTMLQETLAHRLALLG
jgi:elongation factor P